MYTFAFLTNLIRYLQKLVEWSQYVFMVELELQVNYQIWKEEPR